MPAHNNDDEPFTNDYVAELLKRDAKAAATASSSSSSSLTTLRYSAATGKRLANPAAPKPNTRFLKNLIRDTDSHNAALLAREAEESRARLRGLAREKERERERERERVKERTRGGHERERNGSRAKPEMQLYSARARHDRSARAPPAAKRRRISEDRDDDDNDDNEEDEKRRKRRHETESERRSRGHVESHRERTSHRARSTSFSSGDDRTRHSTRRHEEPRRRTRRSRSPVRHGHRDDQRHRGHGSRSHRDDDGNMNNNDKDDGRSERPHRRRRSPSSATPPPSKRHSETRQKASTTRHASVDSLEDLLGPAPANEEPAIIRKGRGALNPYSTSTSAIDAHFSPCYDPSNDVHEAKQSMLAKAADGGGGGGGGEDDDWDLALEALRDRLKWRQQGAERLRAAGFSEAEVAKWESGNGEKELGEGDVRWGKMGEGREWDRGKVVGGGDDDDEGELDIEVKAQWGRLKGT